MTDDDEPDAHPAAPLVDAVRARLAAGLPVRRTLPGGGRLHVDRPLPFLCVYRIPPGPADPGTAELVRTQASYAIGSGEPADQPAFAELVTAVVEALGAACGACLVLELWAGDDSTGRFRIHTASADRLATTIDALAAAVKAMTLPVAELAVEVVAGPDAQPPGREPLISPEVATRAGCLVIGLEVPPLYRSSTEVYPGVLRALIRDLTNALHRAFFEFTRVQTPARPEHYQAMGRRRVVRAVREADAELAELARSFDFLLAVSPTNTADAWTEFCDGGRRTAPTLRYRLLAVDPDLVRRRLYDLPLERLEDPVIASLLADKRHELDRQLGLLDDRNTSRFLPGSLQLYGGVDDALVAEALAILAAVPAGAPTDDRAASCDATAIAARARAELDGYRAIYPSFAATVAVRDDIASLIVSHGDLLVPSALRVAAARVEALLQHEVGTHVVTFANGRSQALQVLAGGLAGYEALQEGLALFAEYVVGGLDRSRLRVIAARVVAVHRLIAGASFAAVVDELVAAHGLSARAAFGIAVRVFRGGGLTKDAIYLRGLHQLLGYLAGGGSLEPLLVGKLAAEHVPLIEELLVREVLHPAPLRPTWLAAPDAAARIERARAGLRPVDLLELEPRSAP